MQRYQVILTGKQPIIFHADDVLAADILTAWRKDPKNKGISVPGDDRSPPWTWQLYLYAHDGFVVVPQENVMKCLSKAGAQVPKPKGKGTFKADAVVGILPESENLTFTTSGKQVAMASIKALENKTFTEQFDAVKKLGFELLVKRAAVGESKHVRVRPIFRKWELQGTFSVTNPLITKEVFAQMFAIAGEQVGLLDWRPSSKKSPGPYGVFNAKVESIK
jgi:hypothetical protein